MVTTTKSKQTSSKKSSVQAREIQDSKSSKQLNTIVQDEITQIVKEHGINVIILENFAQFVIENYKKKEPSKKEIKKKNLVVKPLAITKIKEAIYKRFEVKNTTELKRSGSFKMATDGMDKLDFTSKETWEMLYREFVGILPGEEEQQGYGCINGINIFSYFKPWKVFGLDPQLATPDDIKQAYRDLSKIYHPDVSETGNAEIFSRINTMYKSISAEA
ncbi:MAG TPA: J domain-containing protein [Trichocoleus sp.]|jgi:hypothetical protein